MKPCEFDSMTTFLLAPPGSTGILPLPVRRAVGPSGPEVVSCWQLEPGELEEIQRTGRVWLLVAGKTHAPLCVSGFDPGTPEPAPPAGP